MNIIVIEDELVIRNELKILLENALYEVTVLEEFGHMEKQILSQQPDLILLDLNMPNMQFRLSPVWNLRWWICRLIYLFKMLRRAEH